ncbi:selenide water dikinase SelD [Gottschalkia acidurici 9a]|uniref:Selenide, water dikinase n=1 Tax=Gottschalkia acidurici (strain ATCC 7906 / DSM 604 / BCRC 14475 / CIP 104303 / KCTC 5404 / NCIMB 10678 / 9a) TaxID=1128398 RepID=K0B224_GOTA9|nr:selenide water dikinase SelD [Gottschalkia acidurici 9a]
MCHLPKVHEDENLLVGIETSDDAAVYKINEDTALIQTVDFFTPVVDDPYTFGQIAATNSLSDVYAMGGEPKLAMNIICFPNCLPPEIMAEILKGGYDKVTEAGAIIIGGHTVEDDEPKYGLCASGFIHPKDVLTNSNAKVGDVLVLTKPIGIGIVNTVIKAQMADEEMYNEAVKVMTTLNKFAKDAMVKSQANSCTDITGFGLLGHSLEMAEGSNVTIKLFSDKIPVINGAEEFAKMGLVPAGAYANKNFIGNKVTFSDNVKEEMKDMLYDPQTSGGLLISIKKDNLNTLLKNLEGNATEYSVVGEVLEKQEHFIIVE